ncbi:MAG: DUF2723 domain-containing protein [Caldilineaceae bacterium]|nr:DUF2723 domain-containing protein [Caldilineaceae bacterium]
MATDQTVHEQAGEPTVRRAWRRTMGTGGLLVLAALLLYGVTLDNGLQPDELVGGDLITHQYAQVQARPSNAPGYPIYTMGGWLWFHALRTAFVWAGNPLPNPIPILSSYSTFWALIALWLLYRILCLVTRSEHHPAGRWPIALLLSAYYGVTYFFWYYATTTEQYSSAIAQTLAIVYVYLLWQTHLYCGSPSARGITEEDCTANDPLQTTNHRRLIFLAFLCGISLAHMLTVAFIVPPLVLVVLWQAPRLLRNIRIVLLAVIAALLPLLSYLYVYGRGVAHPEWWGSGQWSTGLQWFWAFVSTAQGREELGWGFEPWCTTFANGFPSLIGLELTWPVVLLGLVGIALLKQKLTPLLYATLVIYLAFSWAYRCGNWFQVILPAYPLLLLGVARLFSLLLDAGTMRNSAAGAARRFPHGVPFVLYILLTAAVLYRGLLSWPRTDSSNRPTDTALDRGAVLLAAPLSANGKLFATVEDALALQYLMQIWQVRPDLAVVSSPAAASQLAAGGIVYSTWEAAPTLHTELPQTLAYTQVASDPRWVRFQPATQPTTVPLFEQQPATEIVPGLTLQGYTVRKAEGDIPLAAYRARIGEQASGVFVLLGWRPAENRWPEGLSISVRLTAAGVPIAEAQQDRGVPAFGLSAPQQGLWLDPYFFPLPEQGAVSADLQAVDGFMVILYRQVGETFENVAVLQF